MGSATARDAQGLECSTVFSNYLLCWTVLREYHSCMRGLVNSCFEFAAEPPRCLRGQTEQCITPTILSSSLFPGCHCCHPILVLIVPPSLSSFSCQCCISVLLSLSLSSPVIHLCHPSVLIPPCHPIVIIINVPKRFISDKKNRMRKKKEKTYLWPKRHQ